MEGLYWIIASITALLLLLVLLVLLSRKKSDSKPQKFSYRSLFVLGVVFLPLGIIFEIIYLTTDNQVLLITGLPFITMGAIYLFAGLANRNTWSDNT